MTTPRRKADLVRRLLAEADRPCHGRGGDSYRVRRMQPLMREAAAMLARWGREPDSRRAQPGDLMRHSTSNGQELPI